MAMKLNFDTLSWNPEDGRFEASRMAFDASGGPVESGVGFGRAYEAESLRALWELGAADLGEPPPAAPDFAAVEALSRRALAAGCSWGGTLFDGVWSIACHDEVRGKWLDASEGASLEEALARAVASVEDRQSWLETARAGWTVPSWLVGMRARASAAT